MRERTILERNGRQRRRSGEGVIDVLVALFIIGSNAAATATQSVFVLF